MDMLVVHTAVQYAIHLLCCLHWAAFPAATQLCCCSGGGRPGQAPPTDRQTRKHRDGQLNTPSCHAMH